MTQNTIYTSSGSDGVVPPEEFTSHQGYTGSRGQLGYTGSRGQLGYSGSRGATGPGGPAGDTGPGGDPGETGLTGTAGFIGSRGLAGYYGSRGLTGYYGSKGTAGYNGSRGATGPGGPIGDTGPGGDPGETGLTGTTGFSGSRGYAGSIGVGYAGSRGLTGYYGSTGNTGVAGGITYSVINGGAFGSGYYTIAGSTNPTLTLIKGFTYYFNNSSTDAPAQYHPFWIKNLSVTGTANAYSSGVTNNGAGSGTITFTVPFDAPSTLYYICQYHSAMAGTINVQSSMVGFTGSGGATGPIGLTGAGYTGSASTALGYTGSAGDIGLTGAGYTGSIGTAGASGVPAAYLRTTAAGSGSIGNLATASFNVTGFKGYTLYKIQASAAAWVRIYSSSAARTADAARLQTVDPASDAGVIAEVITTGSQTVTVTPAIAGFNDETSPTTNIPMSVTNLSGSTVSISVTLTLLQTEA